MARKVANNPVDVEDKKVNQASEARTRRSKKSKGAWQYYCAIGSCIAVVLLSIFLALSGSTGAPRRSAPGRVDALVNDNTFVSNIASEANGNFTTAASPFFNKWTYGDLKYGLKGVQVRGEGMIGMPGALQYCEREEGLEGGALPTAYDVREAWSNCIGEVYDSGNCSSSYAIAAAVSLSARFCISDNAKHANLRLAPQQVLSCDTKSKGCKGGGIDSVFGYLERRGLYPEDCLPYAPASKPACKTTCDESKKHKSLSHCVLGGSEKMLKREIYNQGPVVVPVYIRDDYLVYSGGIYTPTEASNYPAGIDDKPMVQAAVVLGWGKSEGNSYWIIQQAWGSTWGENGYARVSLDTIVREGLAIVATPATDDALAEAAKKQEEAELRKEEAKKERIAREERIREAKAKRAEEDAAKADEDDFEDFSAEDDIDLDEEAEVELD
jgi:cathepsin B